jgi:hypothetical protein
MPDENTPSTEPAPEQTGDSSQADQAGQQHGDGDNLAGGGDVVHGDKIVQAPEGDGASVQAPAVDEGDEIDIDEIPDDVMIDDPDISFDDPDESSESSDESSDGEEGD